MNDKRKQLGYRIRQARMAKGLSQLQLSEKVQISPSHLSDIEYGKKNLGIDIFIRLVQELEVSADWLLQTNTPHVSAVIRTAADPENGARHERRIAIRKIISFVLSNQAYIYRDRRTAGKQALPAVRSVLSTIYL